MAEETENLILAQEYKIGVLKRVLINYKKLPKASVTVPTIQSRISQLKELWAACSSQHVLLLQTATSGELKGLPYFVDNVHDNPGSQGHLCQHQRHSTKRANLPVMKTENVNDLRKLRDTVSSSLAALKNLDRPVNEWDDLLVYLIAKKFSPRTRSEWNLKRTEFARLPSYKDINDFLTLRIRGLSDLSDSPKDTRRYKDDKPRSSVNNVTANKCVGCSGNHSVSKSDATANSSKIKAEAQPFTPTASNAPVAASSNHVANKRTGPPADTVPSNVLLATAWVDVHTTEGRSFKVRALLDQGSTFSFISQSFCQTLRTKRQRSNLQVACFGAKFTGVARSRVVLTLKPCSSAEPGFPLHAYVFQNITSYAASRTQPVESWPHLQGISFADPDPSSRHRIHLLIGADLYGSLLKNGLRQGSIGTPTAQLTALGWIISGPTGRGRIESENICVCHNVSTHDTNSLLRQFWEDEEV
ncbi:PREDICTED: uncharacterized protein LOC108768504 [Trachymyrmex cornetzi]|uniref:uncharacterized protein LOC108768504 n=1 Tax=Trachymyrmex cornetzi TaxID=471704 RepID=UPI00084F46D3|nr:PREDICTED: uncharacterized protein LOC108768504 [Trachymyrmex cornetzi]